MKIIFKLQCLSLFLLIWGCGSSISERNHRSDTPSESNQKGIHGSSSEAGQIEGYALVPGGDYLDVVGLHYAVIAAQDECGVGGILASETVDLSLFSHQNLPPWIQAEVGASGATFGDVFMTIEPGDYKVCVEPLVSLDPLTSSLECSSGHGFATVFPMETTEILIPISCSREQKGGLDAVTYFDIEPQITDLTFNPSKFVDACSDVELSVEVAHHYDDYEVQWTVIEGSGHFTGTGTTVTYSPYTQGEHTLQVEVINFLGNSSLLSFPVHVLGDCSCECSYEEETTTFSFGSPAPKVDYLFVVDNSVSMKNLMDQVTDGLVNVIENQGFSANSKLGVMTTMPASPLDLSLPHPALKSYSGMELEPGFIDLVDKLSIENYRAAVNSSRANNFEMDGCPDGFFSPTATNGSGDYCLRAHLQLSLHAVHGEAGITAYEQLLAKTAGQQTFRQEAITNVIFVSDTHDPGFSHGSFTPSDADYSHLEMLTRSHNTISSLKFHAIAPLTKCTGESLYNLRYFDLTDASGGYKTDICDTTDYTSFFAGMIENSEEMEPRFYIGKTIESVVEVKVDGAVHSDYTINSDGVSITLGGLDPKVVVSVEITYLFAS